MGRPLRKMDLDRDKSEVFGLPGVAFEQNGILFTSDGIEAPPEHYATAPEEETPEDNPYDPNIGRVVMQDEQAPAVRISEDGTEEPSSLDTMHYTKLMALCKIHDIEYTNKADVVAQLKGKQVGA